MHLEGAEGPNPRAQCCESRPWAVLASGLRSSAGRFSVMDIEDGADKKQWPETRRFLATLQENILRKDNWIVNRRTGEGLLWHRGVLGDPGKHWERNPAEGSGQCWGIAHLLQGLYSCALESAAVAYRPLDLCSKRMQRLPGFCSTYKEFESRRNYGHEKGNSYTQVLVSCVSHLKQSVCKHGEIAEKDQRKLS